MNRSRRIMIVEDEPNVRLVFLAALSSDDYLLTTAVDGETALRWLKQDPVDLVLLDLRMPGMGGMETLRRLREAGIETPVVIVSAHDGVPNVVQAIRLGAVDFLPKPTTPESLRKVVAEVLARQPVSDPSPGPPVTSPDDPLSRAKRALNLRDFEAAEAALRQAVAADEPCAEGYYLLGVLHELREERHAAYTAYRKALLADPGYEPAKFHLMKYFKNKLM